MLVRTAPTPAPAYPTGPWSSFVGLGQTAPLDWLQQETFIAGVPNFLLLGGALMAAVLLPGVLPKRRRRR